MKTQIVAAIVGVCDEVEMIEFCLRHLETQGVTYIVVVDMASRDGTQLILREYGVQGRIHLLELDSNPDLSFDYIMPAVEYIRKNFTVDWMLIQDADEFWVTAKESLPMALESNNGVGFSVNRYNACLNKELIAFFSNRDAELDISSLNVWVGDLTLSRSLMDANPAISWISAQPAPKVIIKPEHIGSVSAGGHSIIGPDGRNVSLPSHAEIIIVHVPFLSFRRFERKIRRAKETMASAKLYFSGSVGWHWKRWVDIEEGHSLKAEYDNQFSNPFEANATNNAICSARKIIARSSSPTI